MTLRLRVVAVCTAGLASMAVIFVAAVLLAFTAVGVFATSGTAWTAKVRVLGVPLRVNLVGVVRLATLPGVTHLLDGHARSTPHGRIAFARTGDGLRIRCAPCRVRHPDLAAVAVQPSRAVLEVARIDDRLDGTLAIDRVQLPFTARLRADSIDVAWRLPPTELTLLLAALGEAVPEAAFARIEGTLEAHGTLALPSGRSRIQWSADGVEVGGLGTEALQYGGFRFGCTQRDGTARLVVTGDGEGPWVAADTMGPYLAAAVLAAEDQRFRQHPGYDERAIAELLAAMENGPPQRGASTLTQQLARTLFTGGERTAARKLREALYAIEMERTLGKARILELYLNTVHWGPGLCGAKAAARAYFGKPPARLSAIEAAWLAGALRLPHAAWDDQFLARRPDRTRAVQVVDQMRDWPKRERRRFAAQPLAFAPLPKPKSGPPAAALAAGPLSNPLPTAPPSSR